jgi:histone H3
MARTKQHARKFVGGGEWKGSRQQRQQQSIAKVVRIPKAHTYRPGKQCLRDIRRLQQSTELLTGKLPFRRIVRESLINLDRPGFKMQDSAVLALQEGTEAYLVGMFEDAHLFAIHAKRVTIMIKDMQLACDMIVA